MKLCIILLVSLQAFGKSPYQDFLSHFAIVDQLGRSPSARLEDFSAQVGIRITERDGSGKPVSGTIRVLSDNPGNQIAILADYNDWGKNLAPEDRLQPVAGTPYFEGRVRVLKQSMQYRLLLNGEAVLDPAAPLFTTPEQMKAEHPGAEPFLNSIFWDFGENAEAPPDLRGKPVIISEQGLRELVAKFPADGTVGPPDKTLSYRWLKKMAPTLADHGVTHLELMPLHAHVDGDRWQLDYLAFGYYAIDSRFGSPDDFRDAVRELKKYGIGVILDVVWGHYTTKGNGGIRELADVGIQKFKNVFGSSLFGHESTVWGTNRIDFENPNVRRFLIESGLQYIKRYGIAGFRIDNVDGIRGYPGGDQFLKEWSEAVQAYAPEVLIVGEMFGNQPRALKKLSEGGLGMSAANDVDFFYSWVQKKLQSYDSELNLFQLSSILRNTWNWQMPIMERWITNHDEAANEQPGASGRYVASSIRGNGADWSWVEKKTKSWGSLPLLTSSISLNMLQMTLLQEGSYNSNPEVDWSLLNASSQKSVYQYFSLLQRTLRNLPAFAPQNLHPDIENHTDNDNKVISFLRIDFETGRKYYSIINFGSRDIENYSFGVNENSPKECQILVDSDRTEFGGSNRLANEVPKGTLLTNTNPMHGKMGSLTLPSLTSHQVLLLEEHL